MTAFTGLRFCIWTPWCPLVTKEYMFYFYSSSSFLSWDIIQAKIPHQKKTVGLEAVLSGSWRGWPTMLLAWLVIKQVWEDTQHDITDRIPITVGYPAWHHWHQHTHRWQFLSGKSLYFLLAFLLCLLPSPVGLGCWQRTNLDTGTGICSQVPIVWTELSSIKKKKGLITLATWENNQIFWNVIQRN